MLRDFTGAYAPTGKLVYAADAIRQCSNRDRRAYRGFSGDSDISIGVSGNANGIVPGNCCKQTCIANPMTPGVDAYFANLDRGSHRTKTEKPSSSNIRSEKATAPISNACPRIATHTETPSHHNAIRQLTASTIGASRTTARRVPSRGATSVTRIVPTAKANANTPTV